MARITAAAAVRVLELEGVRTAFGVPRATINPGRGEPGTGEINYHFRYDELDQDGCAGWIGCEYRPRGDTSAGLGWVRPYLRARDAAAA